MNTPITLRQAGASDWPAVEALLRAHKLPTEGARDHLATYLLAVSGWEVVGCAGAEIHGSVALLRSVAVAPGLAGQGIGRLLVERLLQEARARDLAAIYLLTVTAPEYFARYGFKRMKIEDAPRALKASAEFQGACPACAALMALPLRSAPAAEPGLPVAVLGAGPVGLAAVAQLVERGLPFVVLEAGEQVGANLSDYAHVQLFSPWRFDVDAAMARLLAPTGWSPPPDAELPRAGEVVERVLKPFAALPQVAASLKLGARVTAVSREGLDKVKTAGREAAAFLVRYVQDGREQELRARAVIDATGTWNQPNPLGANGLKALGEAEAADRIFYGIPDVAGALRSRYEGKRTLVVGAGHSAANALLALAELAKSSPGTRLAWAVRSPVLQRVFGGGSADALPARGALGASLRRLRDSGALEFFGGLRIDRVERMGDRLRVSGLDAQGQPVAVEDIDEIVCATGQRPDLSLTAELRLKLDPWLESTEALGPLVDPNLHSCGTVRPHGHRELAHPEPGFYTVGVKSYGRAPTFLMATGFEQARSVVAALAGDLAAADRVELELPETGVCSAGPAEAGTASGCCGPAPAVAALPKVVAAPRCCG
ncbi:arsenic resistance N-acetyltransferase ArsN2 [Pelomonas sp. P7]|uniref:Arsenic resistance N-acetyltransferase ArsN2 n=1 Tax=Pelomonas caseinilytica TaxID=2906763 RepID=A0ABS8X902_9BURK|nr:arsenic resistance N-acetyltransferase ArsN2 [Pelomonas sp. P7]MCE4535672.1 arsenic resistance N-acetyltransferase ArsN2 [Pelomonas sp. P7]